MSSKKRKAVVQQSASGRKILKPSQDLIASESSNFQQSASSSCGTFNGNDSFAVASTSKLMDEVFESMPNPEHIVLMKFAESRTNEISHLMQQVKGKRKKLGIQQLPNHMRRRAASHNARRVPRHLREKAAREISKAKISKRPSRKHRRRPSNLLADYARRQKKFLWLETHIWFAKRFQMQELWGYKIPIKSNEKSVRAAFNASSKFAMLQDLSYYCCIELIGPQSTLLLGLSKLTTGLVGLTFGSRSYLGGSREGQTILYHPSSYPYKCIGPVSFLWKPLSDPVFDTSMVEETQKYECPVIRQLWVWCHPMCHGELVGVLQNLFVLQKASDVACETTESLPNPSLPVRSVKMENVNEGDCSLDATYTLGSTIKTEKLSETGDVDNLANNCVLQATCKDPKLEHRFMPPELYTSPEITMKLLKDTLMRHRIVGPLSLAVLVDALKPSEVCLGEGGSLNVTGTSKWWEDYYRDHDNMLLHTQQRDVWKKMQDINSPSLLPAGVVIGLSVKDPRLDLPKQKTIASNKPGRIWKDVSSAFTKPSSQSLGHSPLWDEDVRNAVITTKASESEVNKLRSRSVIPGTRLDLGRDESCVPVIAIQQPGCDGFASGWDIIAPLGWSMPFWIAFIYRGARATGLRELRSTAREVGIPLFPYNFPDSSCGMENEEQCRLEMMTKHYRFPPDKRPSFLKLGIKAPFFMPWETLAAEWEQELLVSAKPQPTANVCISNTGLDSEEYEFKSCLLDLKTFFVLRSRKKLEILQNACTALVKISTTKANLKVPRFNAAWSALEEFASLVKNFETVLRRALVCVKVKCTNKGKPCEYSSIYLLDQVDLGLLKKSSKYSGPAEPLHPAKSTKPENMKDSLARPEVEGMISHCSRKLIGFVEVGEFSFVGACGIGLGHCSLIGLLEVLRMCSEAKVASTVLIRAQDNLQYRLATIEIATKLF